MYKKIKFKLYAGYIVPFILMIGLMLIASFCCSWQMGIIVTLILAIAYTIWLYLYLSKSDFSLEKVSITIMTALNLFLCVVCWLYLFVAGAATIERDFPWYTDNYTTPITANVLDTLADKSKILVSYTGKDNEEERVWIYAGSDNTYTAGDEIKVYGYELRYEYEVTLPEYLDTLSLMEVLSI